MEPREPKARVKTAKTPSKRIVTYEFNQTQNTPLCTVNTLM